MKTYKNLYSTLCSYNNLELAWQKARKKKTLKRYVIDFEENLEHNLLIEEVQMQITKGLMNET